MARKVIGQTGSRRRRWWYAGATVFAAAFFTVFFVGGALGVITGPPASPSSFDAGDGNMLNGTANQSDWNCFANGGASNTTGFVTSGINVTATCSSNLVKANAKQVNADGAGEISWVNGQKFDTACPALAVNNNPPKDEFTNVASYNETDSTTKDLFFYGATIRPNTNGNTSGDVELNQRAGNATTTAGCRTAGDRLVAYDFLNGGTGLNFHVLTWITNQTPGVTDKLGGNDGSGACFVKTDTDTYNATNQTGGCWGAHLLTVDSSTFEGGVNTGGSIAAADNGMSNVVVPQFAFAEFGINLSKAFGTEGSCASFAQVQWESRSSGSSFSSNPQDIETESKTVSNCGEVKIIKHTDPRGTNKSFSYSSDMSGNSLSCTRTSAASFTLNDSGNTTGDNAANTQDCTNVPSGLVHVTETVPSGWTLESLTCSSGGVQDGTTPAKADITVPAGGLVTCTYVNKPNTATLTTSASSTGTVTPGTAVHDTATVTGSTSTYPTGTVSFFICGPLASTSGCTSTDTTNKAAGSGGLTNTATAGKGTATSSDVNGSGHELLAGVYCFEATWPGDTTYPGALDATSASGECFTVSKIDTSTATTPNDGSGVAGAESTIKLGHTIYDTAVVTGNATGGDPQGSVEFFVCGPIASGTCDGTTNVGTDLGSGTLSGNGDNTSTATSPGFTPTATGRYCFRGEYGGSTIYNPSSDSRSTECFTVTDTTTASSTQSWYPNDSGSVSADNGAKLNGTLSLQLYTGGTCGVGGGSAVNNSAVMASKTLTNATSGTVSTNNTTYHVDASGSYSWLVTFTSTDGNVGNSSHCESTSLTITN